MSKNRLLLQTKLGDKYLGQKVMDDKGRIGTCQALSQDRGHKIEFVIHFEDGTIGNIDERQIRIYCHNYNVSTKQEEERNV